MVPRLLKYNADVNIRNKVVRGRAGRALVDSWGTLSDEVVLVLNMKTC